MTVVALGDSLFEGPGAWCDLVAAELGVPLRRLAFPGACAHDLQEHRHQATGGSLALVSLGTNDVRSPDWDADLFADAYARVIAPLPGALAATVPLDLGRPRAGAKVREVNALIRSLAPRVVELDDLAGPAFFLADAVHMTPAGHAEVARRALRTL